MTDGIPHGCSSRRFSGMRWGLTFGTGAVLLIAAAMLGREMWSRGEGVEVRTPSPSPSASDVPVRKPTTVFDRRATALGSLAFDGDPPDGDPRARLFIDNQIEPRLVRMCQAGWLPPPPRGQDCVEHVHTAGYRVTSTLDFALTESATSMLKDAIRTGLADGCNCHNGAIVTIDPPTGEILVYVPNQGLTEAEEPRSRGDIDQLTEINTSGTAFMPLTFLAWFDHLQKAPMSSLWDTNPLQIPGLGTVTDPRADGGSEGLISARAALGAMQEVPAFRAAEEVGIEWILDVAARLGITTLAQHFDPSWQDHAAVTYGSSAGTLGPNVRAIDLAFMNATIANMGVMVGTPTLASSLDLGNLKANATAEGEDYDEARRQHRLFLRGDLRLPGTRELDPIAVLEVADQNGNVLFRQGEPERRQTIDSGSVWLLHTVLSDCTARFIIWPCGQSNLDRALDFAMSDGQRPPAGLQFGRTAFPLEPPITLEVVMAGYSRYGATVAWVGNATNAAVSDGPLAGYAASNTVVQLWKTWMGAYHDALQSRGTFTIAAGFDDLQPRNVTFGPFHTTATDRDLHTGVPDYGALCEQVVNGWFRNDVGYSSECESAQIDTRDGSLASPQTPPAFRTTREFRRLPEFVPELAKLLAEKLGIPVAPIR